MTLDVIRNLNTNSQDFLCKFNILGLSAGQNLLILTKQIQEFSPNIVCVKYEQDAYKLKQKFVHIDFVHGKLGLEKLASQSNCDLIINSISGIHGINPTFVAAEHGQKIALANKESIVAGGEILNKIININNNKILPLDSEHSAIWQCLNGAHGQKLCNVNKKNIKKFILTASGGPFKNYNINNLKAVTPEQACHHPIWPMGPKISIDSATMANKGFEIIEAAFLFDFDVSKIDVVIHPESIVHSMIEFIDGSVLAQMSTPDMHLPIQYALTFPNRMSSSSQQLDLTRISSLNFESPSTDTNEFLLIFKTAVTSGPSYCCALCAADELAVDAFLRNSIKFTDIKKVINHAIKNIIHKNINSLQEIIDEINNFKLISQEFINFIKNK
ncbi:MAG: 1-deoxy-D-xylulose-5-phosphate reductoisomerase [Candidatus Improbicoccus devescovinae]|nr:MAG: 1-deoxy-D-xylulose-5-phosphate reductoisomerase [Candidatus Improbicoccus devescovinae]